MGERRDEMRCIVHGFGLFLCSSKTFKESRVEDVPCAVVQYTSDGCGIIALSYEGKAGSQAAARIPNFTFTSINTRHSYNRCADQTPRRSVRISDL